MSFVTPRRSEDELEPSQIDLPRRYPVADPAAGSKDPWGEQLWRLISGLITLELPISIVDPDDYAFVRVRLVNHLLSRLVVRGQQICTENLSLGEDVVVEKLVEYVSTILRASDEDLDRIAFYLFRACNRARTRAARITSSQKRQIEGFAVKWRHRCYLCGQHLHYPTLPHPDADDSVPSWRSFEIDHLFPVKRGGSRDPSNLASCCQSCNKYKDVLLSFADLPVEAHITISTDPQTLGKVFGGRAQFALLWRQRGECARCSIKFHDASDERLMLVRRNEDDAYHFINAEIVCGDCADTLGFGKGTLLRE